MGRDIQRRARRSAYEWQAPVLKDDCCSPLRAISFVREGLRVYFVLFKVYGIECGL